MSLFDESTGYPPGSWPVTVTDIYADELENRTTGEKSSVIRWMFDADVENEETGEPETIEIDAISSRAFSTNSKARAWATALGVSPDVKNIDAEDIVGKTGIAILERPVGSDWAKVTKILPQKKAKK